MLSLRDFAERPGSRRAHCLAIFIAPLSGGNAASRSLAVTPGGRFLFRSCVVLSCMSCSLFFCLYYGVKGPPSAWPMQYPGPLCILQASEMCKLDFTYLLAALHIIIHYMS
ncbi:hypothetical protein Y032_0071g521 [Ancylostoma ceylanicum]|uniref:Uncharacterized protein n=1 Tax=Ancylostoma ceylanicum TaxID=53326 RepID=A0A016TXV7_9BILA|nr:hypothetical protein Y032_0071g521 [Ancylostoma ceylanicum]